MMSKKLIAADNHKTPSAGGMRELTASEVEQVSGAGIISISFGIGISFVKKLGFFKWW